MNEAQLARTVAEVLNYKYAPALQKLLVDFLARHKARVIADYDLRLLTGMDVGIQGRKPEMLVLSDLHTTLINDIVIAIKSHEQNSN